MLLVVIWLQSNNSNKFVIGKMKDKTGSVGIEEFFGAKMRSFLVDNNEHTVVVNIRCIGE